MYSAKNNDLIAEKELINFTFPHFHRAKRSYVDFYAYDPTKGGLRRKKYMLGRCKTTKELEATASILIHNIIERLKVGWNPFVNIRRTRQLTEFRTILKHYQDYIIIAERKGILKSKTSVDYRSRLHQLRIFLEESDCKIKFVYQFDRAFAVDFLDYLILDKDVSAKTRNNYRTWLSTFANWLCEREYLESNPIEGIPFIRENDKVRDALSVSALSSLKSFALRVCPNFYLACMMEYYTFIRPGELRYIRLGDISIKDQTVYVSSDISKNRKGQAVALNDTLIKYMIQLHIFDYPSQYYLFGKDMVPGDEQIYINRFRVEWMKIRRSLNFPPSYQFYSLKDAGIRDLANSEGIVVARDQARHSDVAVTNKYLKNEHKAHTVAKHFKGTL